MPRQGREFEELVSRIEHWLLPKGATVKSPDHLEDKDTGQQREVDASIRFQAGSTSVLMTVECRDRTSMQDVRWIEQIAAKRDSVGADKTIAVSSSSFSQPAIEKAARLGIEIRTVADITEEEVAKWAHNFKITIKTINYAPVGVAFDFDSDDTEVELTREITEQFRADPKSCVIAYERGTEVPITMSMILQRLGWTGFDITEGLSVGDPRIRRQIQVTFDDQPGIYSKTNKGELRIRQMELTLDLAIEKEELQEPTVVRYKGADQEVVQMAQISVNLEGRKLVMAYSQEPPADMTDTIKIPGGEIRHTIL